ncbi:MAG: hypothetical protein GX250_05805 [Clostridiales bacterium]|nr:hypothetical protein [Clostridiales bacterium]
MTKKMLLKISAGIIAFLLILAVLFIAISFLGNPISANIAKDKALKYINDKYSHLNLELKDVTYSPKDGSYLISLSSSTSVDTYFFLSYRDGEIFRDNYEMSVLSGVNTMHRFCDEYKKSVTALVQAKTSDVTHINVLPEKLAKYGLDLDSAFDKTLVKNVEIIISCIGGTDAKHLSEILKTSYEVMQENGYDATKFGITGAYETALTELKNIKPTHIESENLEEILGKAINNTEYDGITVFSKGQK